MVNILIQLCILMVMVTYVSAQVTSFGTSSIITTVAGAGIQGYSGDGQLATSARFNFPLGVAVTSLGEIIIADSSNHRIRKVLLNGTITTIAGTGTQGYNGDGILATSARISYPNGVAVTSLGEIIIADSTNHRIRKILLDGTITTIAGTGTFGYNGDGILATAAHLYDPRCVAVNSIGEVIILDVLNQRIRKVLLDGTITTIAGTGVGGYNGDGILATAAQLNYPTGVAVTSLGEVLIADSSNHRIRKVLLDGTITTIAGIGVYGYDGDGRLATDAALDNPNGVAVTSLGEVIIADMFNQRIRKVLLDGTITKIAGTGIDGYNGDGRLATSAFLKNPRGVAVNSLDEVIILDTDNNRIRKIIDCPANSIKNGTQCQCFDGYYGYGQSCDKFNCNNIVNDRPDVCSSNGQCVSPNNCKCSNSGYYGANCELFDCYGIPYNNVTAVCSGRGTCGGINNCTCTNVNYGGTDCSIPKCYGILASNSSAVCSGRGICSSVDTCNCQNSGFVGKQCSLYNIGSALSVSFNSSQDYIGESSTTVRVVINNAQFATFYNTRSVTARFTFTIDSTSSTIVINVVFPAAGNSSPFEANVPPFTAVGKVSVSVQLSDTESGIVISDNQQSTNTLSVVNRSVVVGSSSRSSFNLVSLLICLVITLVRYF